MGMAIALYFCHRLFHSVAVILTLWIFRCLRSTLCENTKWNTKQIKRKQIKDVAVCCFASFGVHWDVFAVFCMLSIMKKIKSWPFIVRTTLLSFACSLWMHELDRTFVSSSIKPMSDDRLFVGRPIYRPRKSRSSDIDFMPTFVQLTRWVVGHFVTVV